jgi:ABC-type multidrug transport system fused ATPase/permease subunit
VRVRSPGGTTDVLANCSLELRPGEVLALVGATGSGKSTLVSLFPRLLDPNEGRLLVGSERSGWRDVRELDLSSLRRRVHVVPQDLFLFSDTVAANLRLGAPRASRSDLWRALKLACADEIVKELPDGLETVIGDRGATLSGGQRQRLTLARAFMAKPEVLVLDDATSALDAITEQGILSGLRGLGISVLLVSSKPSSAALADRVLVLSGGRIAAAGAHAALLREEENYRAVMGASDAQ